MFDNYIIEVRSEAAGIVVRDGRGFRFFAAHAAFHALEGQFFRSAREAERAANRHLTAAEASSRRAPIPSPARRGYALPTA
jgi:hypothetical protein